MPGEKLSPEQAANLAKAFLVLPAGEAFPDVDVSHPDRFVGAVTVKGLESYLELQGLDRERRRAYATQTFGELMHGRLNPELFKGMFGLGVEIARPDEIGKIPLAHRTDLNQKEAIQRYVEVAAVLDSAIKDKRKRALQEAQKPPVIKARQKHKNNERPQSKEKKEIWPERINVSAYQGTLTTSERLLLLEETKLQAGPGKLFIEVEDLTVGIKDPALRFLHLEDIKIIVKNGITPEQLTQLFPKLRQQFLKSAREIEQTADDIAEKLISITKEKSKGLKRSPYVVSCAQRFLTPLIASTVLDLLPKEESGDSVENVSQDSGMDFYNCIYHDLLQNWRERFESENLEKHKSLLEGSQDPLASQILEIYEIDPGLLKQLRREGRVNFNGREIKLEDVDQLFVNFMMTDDDLTRIIFNDVLGVVYPIPFLEQGYYQTNGLYALRVLESQFSIPEIQRLLAPIENKKEDQQTSIDEIKELINAKEAEIKRLSNNRNNMKTRRELEEEVRTLRSRLTKGVSAVKQPEYQPMVDRIRKAVESFVPRKKPQVEDSLNREIVIYGAYTHLNSRPSRLAQPNTGASLIKRLF